MASEHKKILMKLNVAELKETAADRSQYYTFNTIMLVDTVQWKRALANFKVKTLIWYHIPVNTDELLRLIETISDECVQMADLKEQLEERIRKTTENFSVYSDKFVVVMLNRFKKITLLKVKDSYGYVSVAKDCLKYQTINKNQVNLIKYTLLDIGGLISLNKERFIENFVQKNSNLKH
ncbi:hypothetical protein V1477_010165 [Vespula maculifrons]|uniref:Uncharacterized protein n=1 Tax=Vespula maculifrons TaxID=7453 RepID=A0ABD2C8L7_VESMC